MTICLAVTKDESANSPCVFVSGIVRLVKRLDYETLDPPELTFQVLAYTPAPDQRSATATVSLTVTDANDHSPKFDEDVSSQQTQDVELMLI